MVTCRKQSLALVLVCMLAAGFAAAAGQDDSTHRTAGIAIPATAPPPANDEPTYKGKPLSDWLRIIRTRSSEMESAFEAIRQLGPEAGAAVPELTKILDEPFTPVLFGIDEPDVIMAKLLDMQIRGDAVDALAAIGEAAAPSSLTLIHWALIPHAAPAAQDVTTDRRYVNLIAMDVLQRMRVVAAVGQFGAEAAPVLAALLTSSDGEQRKLAVAVLKERALPIAAAMLKSDDCEDRKLGLAILVDMWSVVPRDHLGELRSKIRCDRK